MARPDGSSGPPPKTPALVPSNQLPPRSNAPGRLLWLDPGPPKQLMSLPKPADQNVHPSANSPQSSTHSYTFPTMSNTPHADLQFDRDPVLTGPAEFTAQSVVPLSVPGSGVLAAARCHSPFLTSRFPDSAHASFAWNHVMHALGNT